MLIDSFGRRIEYLRLSVTDRCNYRCFYCQPRGAGHPHAPRQDLLNFAEVERLVRIFAELGVARVRLTGGEPLVRSGVTDLARAIAGTPGIEDLSLSTNGHLLAHHARALKDAGVRRVNISLDSLDPATFARITGSGDVHAVIDGIAAARDAGLAPIRLNMVVMRGVNDGEIERMVWFARERKAELRFIETMPVGHSGVDSMALYFPAHEILARIERAFGRPLVPTPALDGAGPARYFQLPPEEVRIGVISAMSQHFCADCNRVRLTASGDLVLCLGERNRVSLRDGLRQGWSDDALKAFVHQAIARKPAGHNFADRTVAFSTLPMAAIGG